MKTRIAIADANLIEDLASQLQQTGHNATALNDASSLRGWLAENEAAVLLLRMPEKNEAANPARISFTERRKTGTNPQACWRLHPAQLKLTAPDGISIPLSRNECSILQAAASANGNLVCRKTLIKALGQNILHYDERRLEALISRLRKKLANCVSNNFPIRGVKGQGYLFGASLLEVGT